MHKQFYKCLGCGRDRFESMYQAHQCNGQYRKHSFPAGFTLSTWQPDHTWKIIDAFAKDLHRLVSGSEEDRK